ncbi:MAG: Gldg family protein [Candidatus Magasanikbacteria bacterium]
MLSIIKKELKQYFDHPTAYVLIVVFLLINSFFFFRSVLIQQAATMRPMFDFLPWILLFFVPAITMKMIAAERKNDTLDLMLIQPFKLWQILLGKLLSALIVVAVPLALTIIIPLSLSSAGAFDWGQITAQYIGAIFLSLGLSAIGLFASSLTKNQVVSYISSLAISFFFLIVGFPVVLMELSGTLRLVFRQLSLFSHYRNIIKGVIDLRNVIYFLSFAGSFLAVTYYLLRRPRANKKKKEFRQLKIGVALLVGISIVVNLLSYNIPGRLDLTEENLYTLSPSTSKMLTNLDDIVTIKLYTSQTLPAQVGMKKREVKSMMRNFHRASEDNIKIKFKTVGSDETSRRDALSAGIKPVRFNVLKQNQYSVKKGYFGLTVEYAGSQETIPFIKDLSNLEYKLASSINKLTTDKKKKIAFISGHGEKKISGKLSTLKKKLSNRYQVEEITLTKSSSKSGNKDSKSNQKTSKKIKPIDTSYKAVIIAGPTESYNKKERKELQNYLAQGGSLLVLQDGVNVSLKRRRPSTPTDSKLNKFLDNYGLKVKQNLVFDLKANRNVSLGGGSIFGFTRPYPFWVITQPKNTSNPITSGIESVTLPWASTVEVTSSTNSTKSYKLLETTRFASVQTNRFNPSPKQDFEKQAQQTGMKPRLVAAAKKLSEKNNGKNHSKLAVIGDSDFVTNQYLSSKELKKTNLAFFQNSLDWLVGNKLLIQTRAKDRQPEPLVFSSKLQVAAIRWGNMLGVPLLVALYGGISLYRRRRKSKQEFNLT